MATKLRQPPKKRKDIIVGGPFLLGPTNETTNETKRCPRCGRLLKYLGGGIFQCKICNKVYNDKEL